jgi:hypothetical protein
LRGRIGAREHLIERRDRIGEFARTQVHRGELQRQLERLIGELRRGGDQRSRGVEFVREQCGARALQQLGRVAGDRTAGFGATPRGEQQIGRATCRSQRVAVFAGNGLQVAGGIVRHEFEAPRAIDAPRAAAHDGTGMRRAQCRLGVVARGLGQGLQQRHDVLARQHREAAGAQTFGDQIHRAEAQPRIAGRRIGGDRQHDRDAAPRVTGGRRGGGDRGVRDVIGRRRRALAPREHSECDGECDRQRHADDERASSTWRGTNRIGRRQCGSIARAGARCGTRLRRGTARRNCRHGSRLDADAFAHRRRKAARFRRQHRVRRQRALDCLGRRHPAITETRNRPDHPLRLAIVADEPSRAQHDLAELHVGDVDAAPHRGDELVAPDRAIPMLDEVGQAIEHASRRRGQRSTVYPQFARGGGETVAAESELGTNHRPNLARAVPVGDPSRAGVSSIARYSRAATATRAIARATTRRCRRTCRARGDR